jgi:quercetin dioxygenase-like cupin family protein
MNIEPKAATRKGSSAWFTGDVYIDTILGRKAEPFRMACGWVHFTPGARTAWHSHAVGQTLLITEGIALVGTRDGRVIVGRPGQVVYTPPGEEHWHGAAPGSFMAHIAVYEGTADGDGATWLEHVTDEQYAAAAETVTEPA